VKGNPGGITYRHWLGLVQDDAENGRKSAACVKLFRDNRAEPAEVSGIRFVVFGYDMDNMKARSWYQSEIPVPAVAADRRVQFEAVAALAVRAADEVAWSTRSAVKEALFERPGDVRGDFAEIGERFWRDTETDFFKLLNASARNDGDNTPLHENWLETLRRAALAVFDGSVPSAGIEEGAWRRKIEARRKLSMFLGGDKLRAKMELAPLPGRRKTGAAGKREKVES
jgi:CRISPR system Cascade subunit CasA